MKFDDGFTFNNFQLFHIQFENTDVKFKVLQ